MNYIFNNKAKIFSFILLAFFCVWVFQLSTLFKQGKEHRKNVISSWVGGDKERGLIVSNFNRDCVDKRMISIEKNLEEPAPISIYDCGKKHGYNKYVDLLQSIEYNHIKLPFPLKLSRSLLFGKPKNQSKHENYEDSNK